MQTRYARGERFDFTAWLRTGRLIRTDARLGAREVKFNPNHDPDNGRFTFKDGGSGADDRAQPDADPQAKNGATWGGRGFSGGGGGSGGGGSASGGGYMTPDEVAAYQAQHPGRDPYLTQPGDTLASIAADHGLTVAQVSALNGISPNAKIGPGQVLALPSGSLQRMAKNGYAFGLDATDRTQEVKGELHFADAPARSRTSQKQADGADRLASDDGGHFIATRFDGPTEGFNYFAQDSNFNRGEYRAIEDGWADNLRSGKSVYVDIKAHYSGSSKRPDSLTVRSTINGRSSIRTFRNEPKGGSNGR